MEGSIDGQQGYTHPNRPRKPTERIWLGEKFLLGFKIGLEYLADPEVSHSVWAKAVRHLGALGRSARRRPQPVSTPRAVMLGSATEPFSFSL